VYSELTVYAIFCCCKDDSNESLHKKNSPKIVICYYSVGTRPCALEVISVSANWRGENKCETRRRKEKFKAFVDRHRPQFGGVTVASLRVKIKHCFFSTQKLGTCTEPTYECKYRHYQGTNRIWKLKLSSVLKILLSWRFRPGVKANWPKQQEQRMNKFSGTAFETTRRRQ